MIEKKKNQKGQNLMILVERRFYLRKGQKIRKEKRKKEKQSLKEENGKDKKERDLMT